MCVCVYVCVCACVCVCMRAKTSTLQKIKEEYYNDSDTTDWLFMPWVNGSHGQLKESKHQFASWSNKEKMQKKKEKLNDRNAS